MARRVIGGDPSPLACLDVTVERNAFGRQTESFVAGVRLGRFADPVRGVFIRAPYIKEAGPGVEVWERTKAASWPPGRTLVERRSIRS